MCGTPEDIALHLRGAILLATSQCPDGTTGDGTTGVILFWVCCAVGLAAAAYYAREGLRAKPRRIWPIVGGLAFAAAMAAVGFVLMMWRILTCVSG